MRLLAIDPGPVVGWAKFQDNQLIDMGHVNLEDFPEWLEINGPLFDVIVYESYQVFVHKARAHAGSKLETSQCIGMIKSFAARNNIRIIAQKPDILPIAQKWSQVKLPSDHSQSHQYSALNHGYFWLVQNNGLKTALEIEREGRT